jgi:hypothetical protein
MVTLRSSLALGFVSVETTILRLMTNVLGVVERRIKLKREILLDHLPTFTALTSCEDLYLMRK